MADQQGTGKHKREPSVHIRRLDDNEAQFELRNSDTSSANALRRVMISEVVTMAIDLVTFEENSSVLNDEIIAHRLGLVPLKYSYRPGETSLLEDVALYPTETDIRRRFRFTRDCDCDTNCAWCSVEFSLDIQHPGDTDDNITVSTTDLISQDPDVQPVHFATNADLEKASDYHHKDTGITILKLGKGQHIKLTCVAKLGIGKEHAKWTPVSRAVFRPEPTISFNQPIISSLSHKERLGIVDMAPKGVLGFLSDDDYVPPPGSAGTHLSRSEQNKYIVVKNEAAIIDYIDDISIFTKELPAAAGKSLIHATVSETDFIFDVEAVGSMPVDEIVLCAIHAIKTKCEQLKNELAPIDNNDSST